MLDRLRLRLAFTGALANSALYLWCAFLAGLVTGNGLAWKLALAAMGVTYLSYLSQLSCAETASGLRQRQALLLLSIALGVAAGIMLLVR